MEYCLQHFVPQFYLKRFTNSEGLLWVYDKDADRIFLASPKNLAAERGFYTLPDFFPEPAEMEKQFGDLEEQASLITQDWLNQMKPGCTIEIPKVNREIMSSFLTAQLLRTSEARTLLFQGINQQKALSREGENRREMHIMLLWDDEIVKEIYDWVYSRIWTFRINSTTESLYTSDDPVKVRSRTQHLFWAQTSVPGAYLLMPLTPRVLMYCFDPNMHARMRAVDSLVLPIHLEPELILDANAHQVGHSRRFVFSDQQNFSLAQKFCHNNPGAVGENRKRFVE